MVTRTTDYSDARWPWTFYGLSTDAKPSEAPNGSIFLEMDTSTVSFFDAENGTWRVWAPAGGD